MQTKTRQKRQVKLVVSNVVVFVIGIVVLDRKADANELCILYPSSTIVNEQIT